MGFIFPSGKEKWALRVNEVDFFEMTFMWKTFSLPSKSLCVFFAASVVLLLFADIASLFIGFARGHSVIATTFFSHASLIAFLPFPFFFLFF